MRGGTVSIFLLLQESFSYGYVAGSQRQAGSKQARGMQCSKQVSFPLLFLFPPYFVPRHDDEN